MSCIQNIKSQPNRQNAGIASAPDYSPFTGVINLKTAVEPQRAQRKCNITRSTRDSSVDRLGDYSVILFLFKWIASDIPSGLVTRLANEYNKRNIPCIEIPCGLAGGGLQYHEVYSEFSVVNAFSRINHV